MDQKGLLVKDSKSKKKFFNQETFTRLRIFFWIKTELDYCHRKNSSCPNYKSPSKIKSPQEKLARKIKSKFAAGQLKSLTSPLQSFTQRLIYVYSFMYTIPNG